MTGRSMAWLAAVLSLSGLVLAQQAASPAKPSATSPVKPRATGAAKPAAKKAAPTKKTAPAKAAPAPGQPARTSTRRKTTRRAAPSAAALRARAQSAEYVEEQLGALTGLENTAALVPFFERLWRVGSDGEDAAAHVLVYGDSHTAADEWPAALRNLLQTRFGDGGGGFSLAGRPFRGYRRLGQRHAMSRGWTVQGLLAREGDGIYGLGGASISTGRAGEWVTFESDAASVELWYWRQPGGGSLRLMDEGQLVEILSTDGEAGPAYFRFDTNSRRIEIETLEGAPVRLFGWVSESAPGVTVETMGINGAQVSVMARWEQASWAQQVARRDPALIILAYGTNEASNRDWTYATYRDAFRATLENLRQVAPAASLLVMGPPDRLARVRGKGWQVIPRLAEIVKAQRDAASECGAAFWDLRTRMGGEKSISRWVTAGYAQPDRVHFTGAGYRLVGEVLGRDILTEYRRFAEARQRVFPPAAPNSNGPAQQPNQDHPDRGAEERDPRP
jgi:lysophospholipase L1-like esterase